MLEKHIHNLQTPSSPLDHPSSDQLDDHVVHVLESNFIKKNTAPLDTSSMGSHQNIEMPMHLIGKYPCFWQKKNILIKIVEG